MASNIQFRPALASLTLLLLTIIPLAPAMGAGAEPPVRAIGPIALTVDDLPRSVSFYTNVLGFSELFEREVVGSPYEQLEGVFGLRIRFARLALGDEQIELREYLVPKGRAYPADSRSNDRWFQHIAIVTSDIDRAYARLRAHHVRYASTEPQRLPDWNRNAAGIRAFYFRDPDAHYLELIQFPPGKGAAKWQQHRPLFLGIDHTAIVVADTETSLRFYRDLLGLRVAGESENYGPEQERLNNVLGAHLRITTMRAGSGPGIEFLQYLTPQDGRPAPADERPNDIVAWQTTLFVSDADDVLASLHRTGVTSFSAAAVELPERGGAKSVVVRDPDGHAMELIAR